MNNLKKYYDGKKEVYGINQTRKKKMIQLLGNLVNKKILDVGCGNGHFGKEFINNGNSVFGVDISEKSVEVAKKYLSDAKCTDIQQDRLPYEDNFFDVIIMGEIIEHLLEPKKALLEIKRVLKNDGFIVITTPNFLVFSNRIRILFGNFEYTETGFLDKSHVHFFHIDSFKKIINELEMEIDCFNNVYHGKIPEFIGRLCPSLFTFQIVVKVNKKKND